MRWGLLLGSFFFASHVWAATTLDFNPVTKKLDLTLDPANLGNVSGITVAMTGFVDCGILTTDASGNFECGPTPAGTGDITGVTAGTGLTGGGAAGEVTVNVGEGLAIDAAADAVAFDPTELLGSRTFGDASTDTIVWTWDRATGTDPTLTFGSGTVTGQIVAASTGFEVNAERVTDWTGTGISIVGGALTSLGSNSFETIAVPAGASVVAETSTDTLTITETTTPLVITGTAATDTIDLTWTTLGVDQGGTGATSLTDGGILLGSGTGAITALGVAANGQIPIGDGTTDPVLAEITGTANQIVSTPGAGTITLSTPQDIATGSTPTFLDLRLAGTGPDIRFTPTSGEALHIGAEFATATGTIGLISDATSGVHYVTMDLNDNFMLLGDPNVTFLQVRTDGTGDNEVRLPANSIGASELIGGLSVCAAVENLAAADDNMPMGSRATAVTVVGVWCHCYGTCTTPATIQLEDDAGNAMTGTATCDTGGGAANSTPITAGGGLVAYEGIRFDVTNAVSPETDEYAICFNFNG